MHPSKWFNKDAARRAMIPKRRYRILWHSEREGTLRLKMPKLFPNNDRLFKAIQSLVRASQLRIEKRLKS